jgi:uncharacterized protein
MAAIRPATAQSKGIFLAAEWRHLVMLNYEVDPTLLQKFVPAGTELDRWNGKSFLSLVGFRFLHTKVLGIPFPFHRNFEEVNLRFYVCRQERSETKRGVVFIREIVPRWAISTIARTFYNEDYIELPMSHEINANNDGVLEVDYSWQSGTIRNRIALTVRGEPALPKLGSQEQFITEHYWGYTAQKDGGCSEYQVTHPAWKVCRGEKIVVEGNTENLYGGNLAAVLKDPPSSAFLADGSSVTVSRGKKL